MKTKYLLAVSLCLAGVNAGADCYDMTNHKDVPCPATESGVMKGPLIVQKITEPIGAIEPPILYSVYHEPTVEWLGKNEGFFFDRDIEIGLKSDGTLVWRKKPGGK